MGYSGLDEAYLVEHTTRWRNMKWKLAVYSRYHLLTYNATARFVVCKILHVISGYFTPTDVKKLETWKTANQMRSSPQDARNMSGLTPVGTFMDDNSPTANRP